MHFLVALLSFLSLQAFALTPNEVWTRIAKSQRVNDLPEEIYKALSFSGPSNQDEASYLTALAILHSNDKILRYVAYPYLAKASSKWPGIVETKESKVAWAKVNRAFGRKTLLDDLSLTLIASLYERSQLDGPDFQFYFGHYYFDSGKFAKALEILPKVPTNSHQYRRAQFFSALAALQERRQIDAEEFLQSVVSLNRTREEARARVSASAVQRLRELAVLNLARLYYEQKRFDESVTSYRTLTQDSYFFYESLNEQAWAFFMLGYPNRDLGALYSATSPFFSHQYNPEAYYLTALIETALCQGSEAEIDLRRFVRHYRGEGDVLREFMKNAPQGKDALVQFAQLLDPGQTAKLGPRTLETLRSNDYLVEGAKALNLLKEQKKRLKTNRFPSGQVYITEAHDDMTRLLTLNLGNYVKKQLDTMARTSQSTISEARLLYADILTEKREKISGQETDFEDKVLMGDEKAFTDSKVPSARAWTEDKSEFWLDELGYHVTTYKSECGADQ